MIENPSQENIIPIERGIEIQKEKIIQELNKIDENIRLLKERQKQIDAEISEELLRKDVERAQGAIAFLIQHRENVGLVKKDLEFALAQLDHKLESLLEREDRFIGKAES